MSLHGQSVDEQTWGMILDSLSQSEDGLVDLYAVAEKMTTNTHNQSHPEWEFRSICEALLAGKWYGN